MLLPQWAAPATVGALMTTRSSGVSAAPWDSLNLGLAVGDDAAAVAENRRRVAAWMGERSGARPGERSGERPQPVWLHQVHSATVVRISGAGLAGPAPVADAAWAAEPGVAASVLVADCLPVLFCTRSGSAVAAAHAGWRGLAAGVLENTVQALCRGAAVEPQDILAWLGPCIGPRAFEVGSDVLAAFGASACDTACFKARARADGSPRWLANLPLLARQCLLRAGVEQISGGEDCTFEDRERFFSFRRDGITGRHMAAVWIR